MLIHIVLGWGSLGTCAMELKPIFPGILPEITWGIKRNFFEPSLQQVDDAMHSFTVFSFLVWRQRLYKSFKDRLRG